MASERVYWRHSKDRDVIERPATHPPSFGKYWERVHVLTDDELAAHTAEAERRGADEALQQLPCVECEKPMKGRGKRTEFEGDYSIDTFRFECNHFGCARTTAEVVYRTYSPIKQARERQEGGSGE